MKRIQNDFRIVTAIILVCLFNSCKVIKNRDIKIDKLQFEVDRLQNDNDFLSHKLANSVSMQYLLDSIYILNFNLINSTRIKDSIISYWQNEPIETSSIDEDYYDYYKFMKENEKLKKRINSLGNSIDTIKIKEGEKFIYPSTNPNRIAFYCPVEMKEDYTYEVRAMLGSLFREDEIKTELLKFINETRSERNESPLTVKDVVTKDVFLGSYMRITLVDPANKFQIINISNESPDGIVKIYDDENGEYYDKAFEWNWKVTPKMNTRGEGSLIIIVTPFDKDMKPQIEKRRDFKINITVKDNLVSSFWDHAVRNPEWTLGSIITPIIAFVVGRISNKRKKKPLEKEEANLA